MTRHKMILPAALLSLVCSAASRAQTANATTAAPGGAAQVQTQSLPVLITTDYRAETRTLFLHATNNSGKEIGGYYISIQYRLPNGTWDKPGLWGGIAGYDG
jgi:hypothetical protein